MSDTSGAMQRRSWAARPALLEAAREPDLLMALLLADLMSPSLWEFRDRLHPTADTAAVMEEIHRFMDRHLFHASPLEVKEIWGCLDLAEERARLGPAEVDYAVGMVRRGVEERRDLGILTAKQDILPLMDAGMFPDYEYSTIDVIRAHRRHLHRGKHKPLGVTSCADEAVLSAALAWAAGHVPLEGVVVFGSPAHYTTLVERRGRGYWFNGKHEYHDAASWAQVCRSLDAGSDGTAATEEAVQAAFDARQQGLDRLITPLGVHRFHTNESTLSPARLARTNEWLASFFGAGLRPISAAVERGVGFLPDPLEEGCLRALDEATDAAAARQRLRELGRAYPGSIMELAHYAFRDLWVEHPQAYIEAAARGHLTRGRAAGVTCAADALDAVAEVAGGDSIFDDLDRIALPDEVLLFGTGTHRDKALLLYTLLRHAPYLGPVERDGLQLVFTDTGSFVLAGDTVLDAAGLREHPDVLEVPGRVLLRLPRAPDDPGPGSTGVRPPRRAGT
jgi:hypothetical protein